MLSGLRDSFTGGNVGVLEWGAGGKVGEYILREKNATRASNLAHLGAKCVFFPLAPPTRERYPREVRAGFIKARAINP